MFICQLDNFLGCLDVSYQNFIIFQCSCDCLYFTCCCVRSVCCQLGQFSRVFRCQLLELFSSVHVSVCPLHVDVLVQLLLSFGIIVQGVQMSITRTLLFYSIHMSVHLLHFSVFAVSLTFLQGVQMLKPYCCLQIISMCCTLQLYKDHQIGTLPFVVNSLVFM